jgi:hypothetical protein
LAGVLQPSLRLITAALVLFESLVAVSYVVVFNEPGTHNAIANTIAGGVTLIVGGLWLVFVLPALILVVRNERLELALGLTLAAIPAAALSFMLL